MGDFFTPEGAPVSEKDLAAHLQAGTAMADPSQEYDVRDTAGVLQKVKGDQIGNALGAGWSILPKEEAAFEARRAENESTLSNLQTVGERALGTASFGLSDQLARTFAPEYENRAAERAAVNGSAGALGEAFGMALPTPIGKGIGGLVGRAFRGAEATSQLGRMALRAAEGTAQGGLEGALYGAGGEVGQAALQDDELTAEKVLSGAKNGGLFGGLLGGGVGALAGGIEGAVASAGARRAGEMDSLLAKKTEALSEKLRAEGVAESKIAERVAAETERLTKKSSRLEEFANAKAIETLEPSQRMLKERAGRANATVDELVQQAGSDYLGYEMKSGPLAGKRIFHGAKNPIDVIDDVTHALLETRQSVGHFEEMADRSAAANPAILPDAAPLQANLNAILSPGGKRAPTELANEVGQAIAPVLVADGKVAIGDIRAASDAIAARIEQTTSKPQLRLLGEVHRALDTAAGQATRDALASAGIDAAQYVEAQRVHSSLSLVHDAIEEMKLDTKSGKHDGGLSGYAMAASLLGHFPHGMAAGASLLVHKLIHERAGGIAAEVAHRVASSDVRLGWGAKAIAGDSWGAARRTATSAAIDAAPLIRRVQEITSTPDGPARFAGAQIADLAQYPNIAQAASMKIIGDLQYLAAHAPAPVGRGGATMTPAAAKSGYSTKASAEWMERAKALQDPGIVVDEVLKGRVPTEAIQALKERRPLLWEKMRSDVAQEVALRGDELPFKRRITIGLAFEFPADRSLQPGQVQAIQASFPKQPASPPPAGQTVSTAASKSAESYQSQAEKIAT